jgi:hypothetical protein
VLAGVDSQWPQLDFEPRGAVFGGLLCHVARPYSANEILGYWDGRRCTSRPSAEVVK